MGTKTGATRKFLAETRREKVETGMTRSKFFVTQKGCTCRDFSPNLHWIMKIQSFGHGNLSQKGGHLQVIIVWLFRFPLALFTQIIKVTTLVNCLNSVWIASWDRTKVRIHGKSRQFSLVSCLSSKWRWIGELWNLQIVWLLSGEHKGTKDQDTWEVLAFKSDILSII